MKLIADTNIIFSILIGGRKLRKLFLTIRNQAILITPQTMQEEIEKLLPKAAKHTGTPPKIVKEIYHILIKPHIKTIKEEIPAEIREKAQELAKDIDPYDWPFVALAMYLKVPLWTGDKGLLEFSVRTKFKYYVAVDTHAVEMLLEGKPWNEIKKYLEEKYGGED